MSLDPMSRTLTATNSELHSHSSPCFCIPVWWDVIFISSSSLHSLPIDFLRSAKQTRGSKQSKNAARSVAKVGTASQASLEASCKYASVVDQPKKGFVKITHVVSNQHCCRRPCESMHIKIIWRILYSKLV
jgi:hypothetical protein